MGKRGTESPKRMDMLRRRRRVGEMMLRGISSQADISAAFDVDAKTIAKDMRAIKEMWLSEGIDDLATRARVRVRQLDGILALAINAFDRSRKPKREISLEQRICDNPRCRNGLVKTTDGDGHFTGQTECGRCNGREWYTVERERITQTAGDPAYLMVAKAVIVESARIEGVYPVVASALRKTVEASLTGVNGSDAMMLRQTTEELTFEAPYDVVVRAMAALEDCRVHALLTGPVADMPPAVDRAALPRKKEREES